MRPVNSQLVSWRPILLNVTATLAYVVLVILLQRIWNTFFPVEQQIVIAVSTLVIAAALSPLLILVWRQTRRLRRMQQSTASPLAIAGALLGAVALATPIYVISAIMLRWATDYVTRGNSAQSSVVIVLAMLATLLCSAGLFYLLRRILQARMIR